MGRSLFEKLWNLHRVEELEGGRDLIAIDLHLLHDLSGPGALNALLKRGMEVAAPEQTFAVPDHGVGTMPGRGDNSSEASRKTLQPLRHLCAKAGVTLFDLDSDEQGIVHVIGPEQGLTLPGLSIVCGDSHTCTQGAFGALAWGIGSTEILQVLATQMLMVEKPKSMRITVDGELAQGIDAKDLILSIIGRWTAEGGAGHVVEFAGSAIRALDMEARMTLCNLAVEFGARFVLIAPDETTFDYVRGRPFSPRGENWEKAVAHWRDLQSDPDAGFDAELHLDAATIEQQITWGVSLDQVAAVRQRIPAEPDDASQANAHRQALDYMGLEAGATISGTPIDRVFIGSCANSRLSDLKRAAEIVEGRRVADGIGAWVVPGSQPVRRAAEKLGLDAVFRAAGFEWREPGCSMCLAMNGDTVPEGQRCVSTSNRNFVGRQGPGARTHVASPAVAAASAILGYIGAPGDLP